MHDLNEFVGTWSTLSKLALGILDLIVLAAVVTIGQSRMVTARTKRPGRR